MQKLYKMTVTSDQVPDYNVVSFTNDWKDRQLRIENDVKVIQGQRSGKKHTRFEPLKHATSIKITVEYVGPAVKEITVTF